MREAPSGDASPLVRRNKIFREKGHYWLEPPAGASRRAREKHTTEIISGLLVLAERGKYTVQGGIVPDPSKAKYASQHLESAYPSILSLSPTNRTLFLERLRELIEALRLGDEKLKGHCEDCVRRL